MGDLPLADGPPPYRLYGEARFAAWQVSEHPEWVAWEAWLWISGLFWDPWQHPSEQRASPTATQDEVRVAVVPGTQVGITYVVAPNAKAVRLIEVADLP